MRKPLVASELFERHCFKKKKNHGTVIQKRYMAISL